MTGMPNLRLLCGVPADVEFLLIRIASPLKTPENLEPPSTTHSKASKASRPPKASKASLGLPRPPSGSFEASQYSTALNWRL